MSKNVFAAIWPIACLDANQYGRSAAVKIADMEVNAVNAVASVRAAAVRMGMGTAPIVFAAPEYYFTKDVAADGTFVVYEKTERDAIYAAMKRLSRRLGKVFLFPGTVLWRRRKRRAQGAITHEGFNTAPVFYKGKLRHQYDKKFNDGNLALGANRGVLEYKTRGNSQLVKLDGIRFGIEVCGDFNQRNLAGEAAAQSIDLEVMMSATNRHAFGAMDIDAVPIRDGGYFVQCDANLSESRNGVWCIQRGRGAHGTANFLGGDLRLDPWSGAEITSDDSGLGLGSSAMLQIDKGRNFVAAQVDSEPPTVPQIGRRGSLDMGAWQRSETERRSSMRLVSGPPGGLATETARFRFGTTTLARPLDANGNYALDIEVQIAAAAADVAGLRIHFRSEHGACDSAHATTDNEGKATVQVSGNRATPVKLYATHIDRAAALATIDLTCSYQLLAPGNVTRMRCLANITAAGISAWYLPL